MKRDGHGPWGAREASAADRSAYADASTTPFWLDSPERPQARPPLEESTWTDLAVVGAGLSGLWAAVLAKERDPERDVIVLDAGELAGAASGRNGGFLSSFLTHGIDNGLARYPEEMPALERLGLENFQATLADLDRLGIDCDLHAGGDLEVAVEDHELEELARYAEQLREFGHDADLLDRGAVQAEIASPIFLGGVWRRTGCAVVDPAKLCWGLARAAEERGVRIHEHTPVDGLRRRGAGVSLATTRGAIEARHALLATSASPGLLRRTRRRIVPVWDYVLVTEPLSAEQRAAIGWAHGQGLGDMANRFHYSRLTADGRILWGGFDAIYYYASGAGAERQQRDRSFADIAGHFFTAFPQLEGIRFSHRWGGAIDTCSRFFAFHGLAHGGRVAYTLGHTGLGVGASRFGAGVALDLLDGRETEATRLRALRAEPVPFPPEPLRWAAIELTRNRLAAADRRAGRRGLWLRTLDRLGLGFDS
jgi:glycine/D-amino acid oxidase-like deaminating enzyme